MSSTTLVTESRLHHWVQEHPDIAPGVVVELVKRLVDASCPDALHVRFPLPDSIGQPGPDGYLDTPTGYATFVPAGKSYWEIGTGGNPRKKASDDYNSRTDDTDEELRKSASLMIVTPRSGLHGFSFNWKKTGQGKWIKTHKQRNDWHDVRVIDGTVLVDWLHKFPAVDRWLAAKMGLPTDQIESPEGHWEYLRCYGEPPPLTPHLFLTNRTVACDKLQQVVEGLTIQLRIDTHFPAEIADFVSAYFAGLPETARSPIVGRCLIISDPTAWNAVTELRESHVLVAGFDIDEADAIGRGILQRAKKARHAVIFAGIPGGPVHSNSVRLPSPKAYQIKEALEQAGYKSERAHMLAQKSDGSIASLLRYLQHLSLLPDWAEGSHAADLAIAQLLGGWEESSVADRNVVEKLVGKGYGEWIETIRDQSVRPNAPLTQADGKWKFVARFEGWFALGKYMFDDQLDRFKGIAVSVLSERDPRFDLPQDQRFAASMYGKVMSHSVRLRSGIANTLALLGSHPNALVSCSSGRKSATPELVVREVLADGDWISWASIDDELPLLAEAAPEAFLNAVDQALSTDPSPFVEVFKQESPAIFGENHLTGLLWGLETLAWSAEYFARVIVTLGRLATIDPGGNWANRPSNSLTSIFLPWLPQTGVPVEKRHSVFEHLATHLPDIAWDLLLSLLPRSHQTTSQTRRPSWRDDFAGDGVPSITQQQYTSEVLYYTDFALKFAKQDLSKLLALIARLEDLPPPSRMQLVEYLDSAAMHSLPDEQRLVIWDELSNLIIRHRKFSDAKWALPASEIVQLEHVAKSLAPQRAALLARRLFGEREFLLMDRKSDYDGQLQALELQRNRALEAVYVEEGESGIVSLAESVESPWRAGFSVGRLQSVEAEKSVLPRMLESNAPHQAQFAKGFVRGRVHALGWKWAERLDLQAWPPRTRGVLLGAFPFQMETWVLASKVLGGMQCEYWAHTPVNPHEAKENLDIAIKALLDCKRPQAAIDCLHTMHLRKQPIDSSLAVRALGQLTESEDSATQHDTYHITEIIRVLQDDPSVNATELMRIEWVYLPVLEYSDSTFPRITEGRMALDPILFDEMLRMAFRSEAEMEPPTEISEETQKAGINAYRLLNNWRIVPGTEHGGIFDPTSMRAWLATVKATSSSTGHLAAALTIIGQVFSYSPADSDGLWIHKAIASELDANDAKPMREGFVLKLMNRRGAHMYTAGQEELEFAQKYRSQAEELESRGFVQLASSLRGLAKSFERDAEKEASHDPFDR